MCPLRSHYSQVSILQLNIIFTLQRVLMTYILPMTLSSHCFKGAIGRVEDPKDKSAKKKVEQRVRDHPIGGTSDVNQYPIMT